MNLADLLDHLSAGSIVSIVVLLGMFIEITPVKFSPLNWLGKRLNRATLEKVEKIEQEQTKLSDKINEQKGIQESVIYTINNQGDLLVKLDSKLDEHVAQSYRTKILGFQTSLIVNGLGSHTMEEWTEVIDACTKYENFVAENKIENGKCCDAIRFLENTYQECKRTRNFADLQQLK